MNNRLGYTSLFFALICFFSCTEEKKIPSVDHINIKIEVVRFEKLLFNLDTNAIDSALNQLYSQYPDFYELYFKNVLPLAQDSSKIGAAVKGFITDQRIKKLYDTTQIVTKNWQKTEKEMETAFKYVKLYVPNFQPPKVYTFLSEYSMQRFLFNDNNNDAIGLGLDLFLGNQYPYKNIDPTNPNFSAYLTRTFNTEHIVSKSLDLIIDNMMPNSSGSKLIDIMVHNGKKLFLKQKFLPTTNDTIIFEYSPKQLDWVKNNELEIWAFFADQNLVFESNPTKIAKYVNDSPNAPGMPSEAPGKTANYIGLKIIEAYIKKFPNTTIDQILSMKDAQKIYELSNYKPKRK